MKKKSNKTALLWILGAGAGFLVWKQYATQKKTAAPAQLTFGTGAVER
jgi:hypothetical protein